MGLSRSWTAPLRLEEFDAWDRQNAMAADMESVTGRGKLLPLR